MKKCLCIPGESGQEGSPLPAHRIFIEIFIKLNKICWSSQGVSPLLHVKYQKQIFISFIEIFWRIWSESVSTAARKCQLCLKLNHCLQDFRQLQDGFTFYLSSDCLLVQFFLVRHLRFLLLSLEDEKVAALQVNSILQEFCINLTLFTSIVSPPFS